jgi:hypothetical protein
VKLFLHSPIRLHDEMLQHRNKHDRYNGNFLCCNERLGFIANELNDYEIVKEEAT